MLQYVGTTLKKYKLPKLLIRQAEKEQDEQHLGGQQSDESVLGDAYEDGSN